MSEFFVDCIKDRSLRKTRLKLFDIAEKRGVASYLFNRANTKNTDRKLEKLGKLRSMLKSRLPEANPVFQFRQRRSPLYPGELKTPWENAR